MIITFTMTITMTMTNWEYLFECCLVLGTVRCQVLSGVST